MKVAQAISKALLVAAALGGASTALAIPDPTTAPSDLIVSVWNTATNVSWVQDLGVAQTSLLDPTTFENPNGFTTSFQVDTSGTQLASNLGAGTYLYSVWAVDYSCGSCGTFTGNQEFFSLNSTNALPNLQNGAIINSFEAHVATYIANANLLDPNSSHLSTGSQDYWATSPSNPGVAQGSFTIGGWIGASDTNGSLKLVREIGGGDGTQGQDVATTPTIASLVGNSTGAGLFSFNQANGTLSYTLAGGSTGVPLPAAGWLLVSGLLGLGAVSRRRNAAGSASSAS